MSNRRTQAIVRRLAVAVAHPYGRVNFINGGDSNNRDIVLILWGDPRKLPAFIDAFENDGFLINQVLR